MRGVKYLFLVGALLLSGVLYGQKYPERRHIRSGNKDYEIKHYTESERKYRQAYIKDTLSVEAMFNLANAQYRLEQYEAAETTLQGLTKNPTMTTQEASQVFYNLGNAQFQQQKLKEALESYKMSQRINPEDMEAKYNLAYTKKLLEENEDQNQDGEGDGEGDQDQDSQDNQDQQQNQDNQDQNQPPPKDEGEDDKDKEGEQPPKPEPTPQEEEQQPNKESAQMLEAVQQAEDKTREKVNEKKGGEVGASGKNW